MKKTIISISASLALFAALMGVALAQPISTVYNGGTGYGSTTAGDLLVGSSSPIYLQKITIGSTGYVLQASSTAPGRMAWVATSTLGIAAGGVTSVANGGTGTSTAPSFGMVLLGDGLGGYSLVATSSLGISSGTSLSGGINGYDALWLSPTTLGTGILLNGSLYAGVNATTSTSTFLIQGTSGVNPFTVSSSTGANYLNILNSGNIGIGTSTPLARLDLYNAAGSNTGLYVEGGAGGVNIAQFRRTNGADAAVRIVGAAGNPQLIFDASNVAKMSAGVLASDGSFRFSTTTVGIGDLMTLTSATRLGIGTTSPVSTLSVTGTQTVTGAVTLNNYPSTALAYFGASGLVTASTNAMSYTSGALKVANSGGAATVQVDGNNGNASRRVVFTNSSTGSPVGRFSVGTVNSELGTSTGSDFVIQALNDAGTLLTTPLSITRSSGLVGIATTTPIASLDVYGSAGTTSVARFSSSTGAVLYTIDGKGNHITGGGTPTLSSCGVSPSVAGNDTAGTITVGSGVVTACTLTFSTPRSSTPVIAGVETGGGLSIAGGYSAKSTTAVTFSFAATVGSGTFDYYIIQ